MEKIEKLVHDEDLYIRQVMKKNQEILRDSKVIINNFMPYEYLTNKLIHTLG